jgi:hypothetical protein
MFEIYKLVIEDDFKNMILEENDDEFELIFGKPD